MFLKNKVKIVFSIFVLLIVVSSAFGQDLIITQEGEEIECKVEEIDPPKIKYKLKSQPDGPLRNIEISKVFMIKYADGTKELFKDKASQGDTTLKKTVEMARAYRPISIGLSPALAIQGGLLYGLMLNFGYELKPVALRLFLDATAVTPRLEHLDYYTRYTFNFNLHYIFKVASGKLEIYPETGVGVYYGGRYNAFAAMINVGVGLDYRISNLFSIYLHPRYQIPTISSSTGLFVLNLGVRFRFGGKKKE